MIKVRQTGMGVEGLTSLVLQGVHRTIYRCWVDPLQRKIPDLAAMKPGWRRSALLEGVLWGTNLGRPAITDLRVHVRRLKGAGWSVIYIGAGYSFEEVRHILFPRPAGIEESPRVFLWQVPALARRFVRQGELVVCELNQTIRWRPRSAYVFTVPRWIRQVLDIARPMEDILAGMNQNMRRNLRKMQKQGFSYVFTQDQKDFDLFYHKMYCPYIYERHGARFTLAEYGSLCRQFRRGGLILIKHDQEPVCGMLCRIVGNTCEADQMGVFEGQFDLVRKGASVALWWFMMDWARCNSLRLFDFGTSRALTADGTFNFKRQWGTRVSPERDVHTKWVFCGKDLRPPLRHHLNKQGFISEVDGLHYRIVLLGLGEGLTDAELAYERQNASRCGLGGILLVSPQEGSKESLHTRQTVAKETV